MERGIVLELRRRGDSDEAALRGAIHDRMTEAVLTDQRPTDGPRPLRQVALPPPDSRTVPRAPAEGRAALVAANDSMGLALADDEIDYLVDAFTQARARPDRRRAHHVRPGQQRALPAQDLQRRFHHRRRANEDDSLFRMIRRSTEASPEGVLSAYSDNAAVIAGSDASRFFPSPDDRVYRPGDPEPVHILMKVETHNHPTAISPYPGAARPARAARSATKAPPAGGASPRRGSSASASPTSASPGPYERPWERGPRPSGPHGLRPRHHARGPHRRRRPSTTSSGAPPSPATSAPSS